VLYFNRTVPLIVASLVAAVAIFGYLAGHRRSHPVRPETTLTASVGSVLLDYPSSWKSTAAPSIPGLPFSHAEALAPVGDTSHVGLIAGELPGGEPGALPRSFVSQLRALPDTAVVDLLGNQAYRYTQLDVPGFNHELILYTIPNPGGEATALACYGSTGFADDIRTCQHVVATLTLVGQSQSYELTPNPDYARRLTGTIQALDQQRLPLRREIGTPVTSATVQRASARLSAVFATAAESLSTLEPYPSAGRAQAQLAGALLKARDAYAAFAAVAAQRAPAALAAARTQVYEAEASVDGALQDFALLGYKQA